MKKFRRNLKGISTIIATIIIVAIAIVMAIAVAYWAMGIGGAFTRFEKLQYTSAYATDSKHIYFSVKNTGSATGTISDALLINGVPLVGNVTYSNGQILKPGNSTTGSIVLDTGISNLPVEIRVQTEAGNQYPNVVQMP
jgi:hypothetical protein